MPLSSRVTGEEFAAHAAFVATLGPNALWLSYDEAAAGTPAAAG